MIKFYSTYGISKRFSDDIWCKIFRLNKSVKLFKYLSTKRYYEKRKRFPIKLRRFHSYRFKVRRFKSKFSQRAVERRKFRIFYGNLSQRKFRVMFFKLNRKISYAWFSYLVSRFEFRLYIVLFRASFFTDTKVPFQLSKHRHFFSNGYKRKYFRTAAVGDIVSLSKYFYRPRQLVQLLRKRRFLFSPYYIIPSFRLPFALIFKDPDPAYFKKTFNFDILNFVKPYS